MTLCRSADVCVDALSCWSLDSEGRSSDVYFSQSRLTPSIVHCCARYGEPRLYSTISCHSFIFAVDQRFRRSEPAATSAQPWPKVELWSKMRNILVIAAAPDISDLGADLNLPGHKSPLVSILYWYNPQCWDSRHGTLVMMFHDEYRIRVSSAVVLCPYTSKKE